MKIYNTLTRQKETFVPVNEGKVNMYVCGVTVYMPLHMGHLRAFVPYDIMVEYFKNFKHYEVFYVRNITDVGSVVGDADEGEDKIELKAAEEHLHPLELVDRNIKGMWEGLDAIRCARPNISPRATGHIVEIIEAVQKMIENGFAYEVNGDVFCDVSKIKNYGILSGNTLEKLEAGARLQVDERKHNPNDFAIWKKAKPNSVLKWNSPWGVGYPGWHIECSVMSTKYLGKTFDIHGGSRELQFPHHENEIAQSCGLGNPNPVKYWVHSGLLNIDGVKMSKSLNNFITAEDAIKKWGSQLLRWVFVNMHYSATVNISDDLITSSESGLKRIENFFYNLNKNVGDGYNTDLSNLFNEMCKNFEQEMDDDFNTPNAIASIYEFIKQANLILPTKCYNIDNVNEITNFFKKIDTVFKCFDFLYNSEQKENGIKCKIEELMAERNKYRKEKNFIKADELKAKIIQLGAEVFDNKDGTSTYRIK